jgi:two-component system sensor histidine kinase KdpD
MRAALFSLCSVALVTGAVYALRPVAPVLSLGVLYLFAVLPVAALWGLSYAVGVSVVSMLAFNFLFLPPTHTFRLADSENWVALAVYLVTAVCVSELAAHARRRAADFDANYTEAARILGVHANYLHRLVRNLNLRPSIRSFPVIRGGAGRVADGRM